MHGAAVDSTSDACLGADGDACFYETLKAEVVAELIAEPLDVYPSGAGICVGPSATRAGQRDEHGRDPGGPPVEAAGQSLLAARGESVDIMEHGRDPGVPPFEAAGQSLLAARGKGIAIMANFGSEHVNTGSVFIGDCVDGWHAGISACEVIGSDDYGGSQTGASASEATGQFDAEEFVGVEGKLADFSACEAVGSGGGPAALIGSPITVSPIAVGSPTTVGPIALESGSASGFSPEVGNGIACECVGPSAFGAGHPDEPKPGVQVQLGVNCEETLGAHPKKQRKRGKKKQADLAGHAGHAPMELQVQVPEAQAVQKHDEIPLMKSADQAVREPHEKQMQGSHLASSSDANVKQESQPKQAAGTPPEGSAYELLRGCYSLTHSPDEVQLLVARDLRYAEEYEKARDSSDFVAMMASQASLPESLEALKAMK